MVAIFSADMLCVKSYVKFWNPPIFFSFCFFLFFPQEWTIFIEELNKLSILENAAYHHTEVFPVIIPNKQSMLSPCL